MKKHILPGLMLLGALALGSCSTGKLAASNANDDDVYYTKAKAGDQPVYAQQPAYRNDRDNQDMYTDVTPDNDDAYYYDDSYAARINRFGYASPFGYYDDYYYNGYAYAPYSGAWGYPYAYNGFGYPYGGYGFGLGYGWGGYGGWGLGFGLGWGGYYGGYPYGYGGYYGGYGYGGYGGWGAYSAYRSNPRPYTGSGIGFRNGATAGRIGLLNGRYPNAAAYGVGRSVYGGRSSVSYGGRPASYGGRSNNAAYGRPQTYDAQRQNSNQPQRYSPPAMSTTSGGSFGGGGGRSGGGGGRSGGGRP